MQISFFEGSKRFKIDKPIRLIELFAGIGSQAKALKNLGVNFEHYRICEFDKYAVQSYNAVHGTTFETSDITKITANDLGIVDTDKYCYIMTYSFPCQDLSNAGLGKGMAKGSGTRSGLLWEVERLLDECKEMPQVLVMENVPQVIGQGNIEHFAKWVEKLEQLGYKNKWQVLNAKDFGIPQNRERCFMVSILGDYYYDFPKTIPLKLRLKDMLEKEVDEKYYLSDRIVDYFTSHSKECEEKGNGFRFEPTDGNCVSKCITTRAGGRMDDNYIIEKIPLFQSGLIQPTDREYKKNNNKRTECIEWKNDNTSHALRTGVIPVVGLNANRFRIRKLTPKECWRLMGFDDTDVDKAIAVGMSNAQLYKQAGNSIVVNVLMAMFSQMI